MPSKEELFDIDSSKRDFLKILPFLPAAFLAACSGREVRPTIPPAPTKKDDEKAKSLLNTLAASIYFTTGPEFHSQAAFIKEGGKYFLYTKRTVAEKLQGMAGKFLTIAVTPLTTNGLQYEIDPSKFIMEKDDIALYPMDPLRPTIDDALKTGRFTYLVRSGKRILIKEQVALPRTGDNSGRYNILQLREVTPTKYTADFSFKGFDCVFADGTSILRMDGNLVTNEIAGITNGGDMRFNQAGPVASDVFQIGTNSSCTGQMYFLPQ